MIRLRSTVFLGSLFLLASACGGSSDDSELSGSTGTGGNGTGGAAAGAGGGKAGSGTGGTTGKGGAAGTSGGTSGAGGTATGGKGGAAGSTAGNGGSAGAKAGNGGSAGATAGNGGSAGTTAGNGGSAGAKAGNGGSAGATAGNGGSAGAKAGNGGSAGATAGNGGSAGATAGNGGSAGATAGNGGSAGSTAGNGGSAGTTAGNGGSGGATAGNGGSAGATAGNGGGGGAVGGAGGASGSAGTGGSGGSPQFCTCAANTDLVYVLSDNAELWSFAPKTLTFTKVTTLACAGLAASTFSMSVDRTGKAWVLFQSKDIRTIDVNNPTTCDDPGYTPDQMGFGLFGMGFVSNSISDPCDKLYAHTYDPSKGFGEGVGAGKLGVIDPLTTVMSTIGPVNYNGGELTGTGDGRLFAFAGANPAKLVEYDKTTALPIKTTPLNGLSLTNAFAFAAYAGSFYMFTESNGDATKSKVTFVDGVTYSQSQVVAKAPIRIVGAGVSTCAPHVP